MRKKRNRSVRFILIFALSAALTFALGMTLGLVGVYIHRNINDQPGEIVASNPDIPDESYTYVHIEDILEDEYPPRDLRYISWQFITYSNPDFMAEVTGNFASQYVEVLYEQDGWALIHTHDGDSWTYIADNKMFINRIMGVFDGANGDMVDRLYPQVVRVAERYENWLEIYTAYGYVWIDLDFQPPIHVLEDFMQEFGNTVSVFYENLESGFIFRHNADRVYFGASATKAQFGLYIYLKTERGEASMDDVHTFISADYWGGSGFIRHRYGVGQTFTQRQLLHLMITPSDNIATRILRRVHTLHGFTAFMESIGANPALVHNLTFSELTANEAGIFLRAAYDYINSGGRYSHEFRDNLLANRYAFIVSDYPVASKSGWSGGYGGAWHDQAIIFAPSPYSLALLSSRTGNWTDQQVYNRISMFIQEFNTTWFYPSDPTSTTHYTY